MVDLGGYVIILTKKDSKIKLFGSPADRSDCDEILEINGKNLENASHQNIVEYIHECIRTRTICLRVKRRTSSKLDPYPLIDAFVIGSRAKEHLKEIARNSRITPRDIAQLSKILNLGTSPSPLPSSTSSASVISPEPSAAGSSAAKRPEATTLSNHNRSQSTPGVFGSSSHQQTGGKTYHQPVVASSSAGAASGSSSGGTGATASDMELVELAGNRNVTRISVGDIMLSGDTGSHRELPVDVPESFVGVVKQAPRYPPPIRIGSAGKSGASVAPQSTRVSSIQPVVVSSQHHLPHSSHVTSSYHQQDQQLAPEVCLYPSQVSTSGTASVVNHYNQQQHPPPPHHKAIHATSSSSSASGCPVLPDLDEVLVRLTKSMGEDMKEPLRSVSSLVSVYKTIMQQKLAASASSAPSSPVTTSSSTAQEELLPSSSSSSASIVKKESSCDLILEIITMLQEETSLNNEAAELLEILTRFELEGVCFAFDQILRSGKISTLNIHPASSSTSASNITSSSQAQKSHAPPVPSLTPTLSSTSTSHAHPFTSSHGPSQATTQVTSSSSSMPLSSSSTATPSTMIPSTVYDHPLSDTKKVLISHGGEHQQQHPLHHPAPHPPHTVLPHHHPLHPIKTDTLPPIGSRGQMSQSSSVDPLQQHHLAHHPESCLDPSVKVVRIEKSSQEPLGATVRNEPDGSVIIGRIVKGGAAEKSGLLHEGDEVLEVNGHQMKGLNVNQVCDLLSEMTGTLTFVIATRESSLKESSPSSAIINQGTPVVHLRALFDYDPDDDLYIPCRELGICFTKGEILHVIDQTDPNWWQAYREGEHDNQTLAGLIPSITFQIQRESMKQSILSDTTNTAALNYKNNNNNHNSRSHKTSSSSSKTASSMILLNCGKKYHQRRKKRKSSCQMYPGSGSEEILTFEEVALYYPRANIKRPIVLIGPTNIGRHELRQRLMCDTERFAAAVPHTSRTRRDGEVDSVDYHFVTRAQFEQDIKDGKFVEHGEYEKNYYGTSLAAIEAVVQSGKICVLNLHVHSIPILRQGHVGAKLKPYFVFVSPRSGSASVAGIEEARDIEARYGHYFDMILSVTDIERAFNELLTEINVLERDPQWIPIAWLK